MTYYWVYLFSIPVGFLLTSHFLHYKKKYFWYEYLAVFMLPLVCLLLLYKSEGNVVISVFVFWSLCGIFLEAMVGMTYLRIRGKHLWVYEKYPLFNRTTSWLAVPFWAFVGSGTWAINRVMDSLVK